MDPPLRLALAKSLMLLRNRGVVSGEELLPLWVSCLRLRDKSLRKLVCAHVVADVKRSNSKRRDDRLNRAAQAALGSSASLDESSAAARASLGLLAELWRRRLWRDARTANAVAGGCSHADERVAVSALKFFLGEDAAEAAAGDESSSDDDDDDGEGGGGKGSSTLPFAGPGKADIYKATALGTASSKKKKQAKLKRAMASVKRAAKRERSATVDGFAALQLLHDPQVSLTGFSVFRFFFFGGGAFPLQNSLLLHFFEE
jgi:protein SDA1